MSAHSKYQWPLAIILLTLVLAVGLLFNYFSHASGGSVTSLTTTKTSYSTTEPIVVSWSSQGSTMCNLAAYAPDQTSPYAAPKVGPGATNFALDFENNGSTGSIPGNVFHSNTAGTHRIQIDCGSGPTSLTVTVTNPQVTPLTTVISKFGSSKTSFSTTEPIILSWSSHNTPNQVCLLSEYVSTQTKPVISVYVSDNAPNYSLQFQNNSYTDSWPAQESHTNNPGSYRLQLDCDKATASITVNIVDNPGSKPSIATLTATKSTYGTTEPIVVSWSSQNASSCVLSAYAPDQSGTYTSPKVGSTGTNYSLDFENNGSTGSIPPHVFHSNSIGIHKIRLDCSTATAVLSVTVSNTVTAQSPKTDPTPTTATTPNPATAHGTSVAVGTKTSADSPAVRSSWLSLVANFFKQLFHLN